jgi:hypothetical protein
MDQVPAFPNESARTEFVKLTYSSPRKQVRVRDAVTVPEGRFLSASIGVGGDELKQAQKNSSRQVK